MTEMRCQIMKTQTNTTPHYINAAGHSLYAMGTQICLISTSLWGEKKKKYRNVEEHDAKSEI